MSQASANQRAGRCGRVADGICIRLYAEDDFDARPEFTDPEILRTNLASVILQMIALGLGDVDAFPFLDTPDRRAVADGLALLDELGALEHGQRTLTAVGRALSPLPVDPRLGRMVLEADRTAACARCWSSPRRSRSRTRASARPSSGRRRTPSTRGSIRTGLGLPRLRQALGLHPGAARALTGNRFRKLLREEFLHFLRIREWQDLHGQLRIAARPRA